MASTLKEMAHSARAKMHEAREKMENKLEGMRSERHAQHTGGTGAGMGSSAGAGGESLHNFKQNKTGHSCAWEYGWGEVGTAKATMGMQMPDRRQLREHDRMLNTVAGTNALIGAPPGQGPSSSSKFRNGCEGMTYVDDTPASARSTHSRAGSAGGYGATSSARA